jgi:hypothetical protein
MRIDIKPFWTFGLGFYMEDHRTGYSGSIDLILLLLFFGVRIEFNRKRN